MDHRNCGRFVFHKDVENRSVNGKGNEWARETEAVEFVGNLTSMFQSIFFKLLRFPFLENLRQLP